MDQAAVERIQREYSDALRSREEGNEGKARVCARRAAGWAIGLYAESQNIGERHENALEHLKWFSGYPAGHEALNSAAQRLTIKVNLEGDLPHREDPIEDARLIIESLLNLEV